MRTEILLINQRTDTFPKVFLGNRLGNLYGAFLPSGDWLLKGERRNLREKVKLLKKLGGKYKALRPRKSHLQAA